jgi:hypothetical protein
VTYLERFRKRIRILLLQIQHDLQIRQRRNTEAFPELDKQLLAILNASQVEDGVGIIKRLAVDVERPNLFALTLKRSLNGHDHVVPGHRRRKEEIENLLVEIGTVQGEFSCFVGV